MIVSRKQAGLVVAVIGVLLLLAYALGLGVLVTATHASSAEVLRSGLLVAVAAVLVVASYRFAFRGTGRSVIWLCLGVMAVDALASTVTRTSLAASIVLLVILAGCFVLTLGQEVL